jgi:hypothetical protein
MLSGMGSPSVTESTPAAGPGALPLAVLERVVVAYLVSPFAYLLREPHRPDPVPQGSSVCSHPGWILKCGHGLLES